MKNALKKPSFVIGLLTLLCALPAIAATADRLRAEGTVHRAAVRELVVVPLIYMVVRYAERQMR